MMNKPFFRVVVATCAALITSAALAHEREDVHPTAADTQPLLPGMTAPAFELPGADGAMVSFAPGEAQRPLVLTFYRGGWCPFCNLHLMELRGVESELREMGFEVWFVSMDRPEILRPSLDEPLEYTLLSDSRGELTRAFGIAFRLDDDTYARYQTYDIDLEEISGETHHILPVPSTYIIAGDGMIHFQYSNTDYHVRLDAEVLRAAARAFVEDSDGRLRRAWEASKD